MPQRNTVWAYGLSSALLLMMPFDILASLAMDIYLPVVPTMPGVLDTTPAVIQLTLSLYLVILGVGQVVFGPLSDRIGRRPVLLGGAMLFAVASFCLAASSIASAFVAFRLLQAIGASAMLVATFATVRDVYADRPESAVIYGFFSSVLAFVPALGPIAGAVIDDFFGWQAIFIVLGIVTIPAALHALVRWSETRPGISDANPRSVLPILRSRTFWTYALAFSAAMGSFFVFFSTAPRVLIDRAGYSELQFSLAFSTAAVVMIFTTRFIGRFVAKWAVRGCAARGMAMLLAGAGLLALGQIFGPSSFLSFVVPMWVISAGIVLTVSVTANGALADFGDRAGSAVAVYFCVQSLFVGILGTSAILAFGGDTAWPLVIFAAAMAILVLTMLSRLESKR